MVLPTSSISSSTISSALQPTSAASSSATGVSSVNSSISSAAPESATASKGCCASISSCITSVINSIRDCLSCLPLIGHWFKREAAVSSTTEVTSTLTQPINDDVLLAAIEGFFPAPGQQSAQSSSTTAIASALVDVAKDQFVAISSPLIKMKAFRQVMVSTNATDDIRKDFFRALPVEMQNAVKTHIWDLTPHDVQLANRDGNGHEHGYGDYIVYEQITTTGIVLQAVDRHIAALTPVVSSTTSSST